MIDSAMMFNTDLNNLLLNNGISAPKIEVNQNSALNDSQVSKIVSAIDSIEPVNIDIGKNGLNFYVRNGHSMKEVLNDRINFRGRKV